mmetsp:Transcript_3097/g.6324  ORF Transcript_3097/g.6324 Transcript_3097/m.6324 type:complete len:293 (+) Transcript_3097:325-1203(+)
MSNFFAALDDSGDEGRGPAPAAAKKAAPKKAAPKKEIVEPSKVENHPQKNNNRNTKGGRGGRPPARDGKRTFDRRSGTGRGREIKKEGGGGHNWGNDKNDAKKAEGPVEEGNEEINTAEEETENKAEGEEEAVVEKVEEPEDKTLSFDEYMKQKQRPDSDLFKPREAPTVENEFAGKTGMKKEEVDFLVMGSGKAMRKRGGEKKGKQTLVLDFKVKSATSDDRGGRRDGRREGGRGGRGGGDHSGGGDRSGRGGGDRGGRGGDRGGRRERGGRGRGGGRGLDATDPNAFPSL